MLVLISDIEILHLPLSVVGKYESLYDVGQIVVLGKFDALCDMVYYHLGTLDSRQSVMWVSVRLVFCKENRSCQFANVVV